jgi:hypothetical protein
MQMGEHRRRCGRRHPGEHRVANYHGSRVHRIAIRRKGCVAQAFQARRRDEARSVRLLGMPDHAALTWPVVSHWESGAAPGRFISSIFSMRIAFLCRDLSAPSVADMRARLRPQRRRVTRLPPLLLYPSCFIRPALSASAHRSRPAPTPPPVSIFCRAQVALVKGK